MTSRPSRVWLSSVANCLRPLSVHPSVAWLGAATEYSEAMTVKKKDEGNVTAMTVEVKEQHDDLL